jgi:hypothetical protein
MTSTRVVKIARDKAPNSKRNIGRPKKRWRQSLETGQEQPESLSRRRRRLSHKRHDFRRNVIEYKMCILIFSTTFVWNISHFEKISEILS